jgi:hypothetical protein
MDTGSSLLVIEKQYLTNYQSTNKKVSITYGYNKQSSKDAGVLVYSDLTFDTTPKITAKHIPIIMVPDGTFKHRGFAGVLGLKLDTQNSPWNYLPEPYNQTMIIDGPALTMSFGPSSKEVTSQFHTYQITETTTCQNKVKPRPPINQTKCWNPYVPVTYSLVNEQGKIVYNGIVPTLFDSGGYDTHLLLPKIPPKLKQFVKNGFLKGKVKSAYFSKDNYPIPTTNEVKVSQQKKLEVNSGHDLFYNKAVLFDSANGIVGVK